MVWTSFILLLPLIKLPRSPSGSTNNSCFCAGTSWKQSSLGTGQINRFTYICRWNWRCWHFPFAESFHQFSKSKFLIKVENKRDSRAGSVIQAIGMVEFKDGLRTGVLLVGCWWHCGDCIKFRINSFPLLDCRLVLRAMLKGLTWKRAISSLQALDMRQNP